MIYIYIYILTLCIKVITKNVKGLARAGLGPAEVEAGAVSWWTVMEQLEEALMMAWAMAGADTMTIRDSQGLSSSRFSK